MHAIFHELKRAHLAMVVRERSILVEVPDMTPARFEILYFMLGKEMEMGALRRTLRLSRLTVSEAVKRLSELGLVTHGFRDGSRRNKVVALTEEGRARTRRAVDLIARAHRRPA